VVIGIGADSGRLLTYQTSVALCGLLGGTPVEFPAITADSSARQRNSPKTLCTLLS